MMEREERNMIIANLPTSAAGGVLVANRSTAPLVEDRGFTPLVRQSGGDNVTNATLTHRDESLARLEILVQIIILVLALLGNSCVLTALARRGKAGSRMHMFIFHLSIADLLVAVFNILPQLIWDVTETFVGGDLLCRFVKFMQVFVMYLSTYMLVMTAVDRYLSVCHPLSSFNTSSKTKVYAMIAFAYALSALLSLPQPIIFKYQERKAGLDVYDCWVDFNPAWTLNLYVTSFTVAVYLIPLAILVYTYVSICHAIWQKQKHNQSQCQLEAHEKTTCLSHKGINVEANGRAGDTGTGALPGQRGSSCSRTHSTSSSLDNRGVPTDKHIITTRGCSNTAAHRYVTSQHPGNFHSHKYGTGTRAATLEAGTGVSPSGFPSGRFRERREGEKGRAEPTEEGRKRSGRGLAGSRQSVGRSNAIRRRVNLVVSTTNGSTRSSTGSVRGLSRAKMKTVKLTFVVIVAYVVCWSPFFVSQLWWLYDASQENNDAVVIMVLLGSLNSCCNPWIYLSFSGKIVRRVGFTSRRSKCCCSGWLACCFRPRCCCRSCCFCWPGDDSAIVRHPPRVNKHVNNNSSNREDHNKEGQPLAEQGEKFIANVKADLVCTGGIGVVPSIELRDLM